MARAPPPSLPHPNGSCDNDGTPPSMGCLGSGHAIEMARQLMIHSNRPSSWQAQEMDLHLHKLHQLITEKNRALEHTLPGAPSSVSALPHLSPAIEDEQEARGKSRQAMEGKNTKAIALTCLFSSVSPVFYRQGTRTTNGIPKISPSGVIS